MFLKSKTFFYLIFALFLLNSSSGFARQNILIPPPNEPTQVSISLLILDFKAIILSPESFSIIGYLQMEWTDSRLIFDPKTIGASEKFFEEGEIWDPMIEFVNTFDIDFEVFEPFRVNQDGKVKTSIRFGGTFASKFDLKTFPFDKQKLQLVIESLSFNSSQVEFVPNMSVTNISPNAFLEEWKFDDITTQVVLDWNAFENAFFSRLIFIFPVKRYSNFYLLRFIFPLFLLTLMSFISLWIPINRFHMQLDNSRTMVLTIVAMGISLNFSLPRLGYLTLVDHFVILCFLMVLVLPFENLFIHRITNEDLAYKIRKVNRIIFPVGFLLISAFLLWKVL